MTDWNFDQALGWVLWRDKRIVEKLEGGKLGSMMMYPPDEPGYGTKLIGGTPIQRVGKISDLLHVLRFGKIIVRGCKNGVGDREIISVEQWRDLEIKTTLLDFSIAQSDNGKGSFWTDIKIGIEDLQKIFTEDGGILSESNTKHGASIKSETECKKWLMNLMANGIKPSKSKAIYLNEAQERFNISRRSFYRAWMNAIAETGNGTWSKPGRR